MTLVTPLVLDDQLAAVQSHLQARRFAEAEQTCRQILRQDALHIPALRYLASLSDHAGRPREAAALLQKMLTLAPHDLTTLVDLAGLQQRLGDRVQSEILCRVTLALAPNFGPAQALLGSLFLSNGQFSEAIGAFRKVLDATPGDRRSRYLLSTAKLGRGAATPPSGTSDTLHRAARIAHAVGSELRKRNRGVEARDFLRQAVLLKPDGIKARIDLGVTLQEMDELEDAITTYRQAVEIDPNAAQAWCNLGIALHEKGEPEAALQALDEAQRLAPEQTLVHWNRALVLLLLGRWQEGWEPFEQRWQLKGRALPHYPAWQGEPLNGRTLLITPEQGLGDTLQMLRYLPLLGERLRAGDHGRILFACPPEFRRLLGDEAAVDLVYRAEDLVDIDCACPSFSLPRLFATTPQTIPATYKKLHPAQDLMIPPRLQTGTEKKIGLAWAGRESHPNDQRRSCPLPFLRPLLDTPNTCFVSLQKGIDDAALIAGGADARLFALGATFTDLADTAAAIERLDLVITVDTVITHLAGSLGKETWLLLPFASEWRWLRGTDCTGWYPSVTLFRQSKAGDWPELLQRISRLLQEKFGYIGPVQHGAAHDVELS